MKKVFLFAACAAMMAACSSDNLSDDQQGKLQTVIDNSVSFDAYMQRATTRAGQTDIMTNAALQTSGFGVFGYYTDNNDYEQSRIPDFFYNQKMEWDGGKWVYEPVKYWPNEYGASAISDDNDRVSFFAYAPYVVTTSSGKIDKAEGDSWGITGLSRNSAAGDPLVKYIASFEADKSVDLLWGVCDDTNWPIIQGGDVQQINDGIQGLPWLNVQRPKDINHKMKFQFKHALTQLTAYIDAVVDEFTGSGNQLGDKTKIYVRSVSFTGVAIKGSLNLNNTEPNKALWLDYNGTGDLTSGEVITIYDGLKDGKEGTSGNVASNEKVTGLNPAIISNYDASASKGNTTAGVLAIDAANGRPDAQPLFATMPVMLIPTGEDMEVEIVYDVETEDAMLSTMLSDGKTHGSSIENRIKKTVSFGTNGLENGKNYTLKLHLGMNSVKVDAGVSDWQDSYVERETDLPANMPSFAAQAATLGNTTVNVTAEKQDYQFMVTGLTPGETVTATIQGSDNDALTGLTPTVGSTPGGTDAKADVNGIAYVKLPNMENTTVRNLAAKNYLMVQGASSNLAVKLEFNQSANKWQMKVAKVENNSTNDEITLASGYASLATNSWEAGALFDNGIAAADIDKLFTVKVNGVAYTYDGSLTAAKTFKYDGTAKKITVFGNLKANDVVEITVNNGEAPAETFFAKIGGIAFLPDTRTLTYKPTEYDEVKSPTVYGTPGSLTWESGTTATATIGNITGKITTVIAGSSVITATSDQLDGNGWFYTDASKTATYTLTVVAQDTKVTFTTPNPPAIVGQTRTAGDNVISNAATAAGVIDNDGGTAYTAATGAVSYAIVGSSPFVIDPANPQVKVGAGGLAANTTYVITVRATAAAVANKYNTNYADYTITVTTGN